MIKRILSLLLCISLSFSVLSAGFKVSAEEQCIVSVDTMQANAGDTLMVRLRVKNNPGIMAMTISITYDSSALEFKTYYPSIHFTDYTLKAHPNRNLIRLVICEKEDKTNDGAIVGLVFKVADDAEAKLHEMTVKYSSGDFCNYALERIMPKIVPGGIDVAYNGSNCKHRNYGEWTETMPPSCKKGGVEQRSCTKCGHTEMRENEPLGHDFEDKWVVDIPATKDTPGTMSRHCKRCDATTDETNFKLQHTEEGNIENKVDGTVPENDVVKDIIDKQHPELKEENNKETPNDTNDEIVNGENNKIEDGIEDILGVISPDEAEDKTKEKAITITQKLKEIIPQIDTLLDIGKYSLIALLLLLLI